MTEQDDLLSMCEVMAYAKIGRCAVYSAIKKGRLKAVKDGHFWKISRKEIDRYRIMKYNRDQREINGDKIFCVEKGTFSVNQVAKIVSQELGIAYTTQRVYHLIRTGQLKTAKCGASFVIKRDDLISLIDRERNVKNEDYRKFAFMGSAI